jgi:hypothetical protein
VLSVVKHLIESWLGKKQLCNNALSHSKRFAILIFEVAKKVILQVAMASRSVWSAKVLFRFF